MLKDLWSPTCACKAKASLLIYASWSEFHDAAHTSMQKRHRTVQSTRINCRLKNQLYVFQSQRKLKINKIDHVDSLVPSAEICSNYIIFLALHFQCRYNLKSCMHIFKRSALLGLLAIDQIANGARLSHRHSLFTSEEACAIQRQGLLTTTSGRATCQHNKKGCGRCWSDFLLKNEARTRDPGHPVCSSRCLSHSAYSPGIVDNMKSDFKN